MTKINSLPNFGFLTSKLSEIELDPIKQEIAEIQQNFNNAEPWNNYLAGVMQHEYHMVKSRDYIESLVMPYIIEYESKLGYIQTLDYMSGCEIMIEMLEAWANFQSKHEHNPIHSHNGVYSFVIYIKIPFTAKEEVAASPGSGGAPKFGGTFMLHYTDTLGRIQHHPIVADKDLEGTLLIFPAQMRHSVLPFYSTDEYRISVAGNFGVRVKD